MDERKKRGDWGEAAVAAALERRGWTILARQYRCRWGEIDLKTRSPQAIAPPREAVTASKRRKLRDAASWYLVQTGLDCPCRFDVAEVYPADAGGRRQINYITGAFE